MLMLKDISNYTRRNSQWQNFTFYDKDDIQYDTYQYFETFGLLKTQSRKVGDLTPTSTFRNVYYTGYTGAESWL